MNPPMNDEALRKQIAIELENFYRFGSDDDIDVSLALNKIMPLFQEQKAASERVAGLISRIDELLLIGDEVGINKPRNPAVYNKYLKIKYLDARKSKLVAELAALQKPEERTDV